MSSRAKGGMKFVASSVVGAKTTAFAMRGENPRDDTGQGDDWRTVALRYGYIGHYQLVLRNYLLSSS